MTTIAREETYCLEFTSDSYFARLLAIRPCRVVLSEHLGGGGVLSESWVLRDVFGIVDTFRGVEVDLRFFFFRVEWEPGGGRRQS